MYQYYLINYNKCTIVSKIFIIEYAIYVIDGNTVLSLQFFYKLKTVLNLKFRFLDKIWKKKWLPRDPYKKNTESNFQAEGT